jgi:hypothetical protein
MPILAGIWYRSASGFLADGDFLDMMVVLQVLRCCDFGVTL